MTDLPVNYQSPKLVSNPSIMQKVLIWIQAMRAPFFTASIVPLVLGMAIVWMEHQVFDPVLGFITLLSGVTIQAGTNLCNDYFDQAADAINEDFTPFSGGSRIIQNQILGPRQILIASIFCFIIGILSAIFLVIATNGLLLIIFLLVAVLLGIFYTAFPVRFSYRGLGEIAVFVGFGPLGVFSAYYIQVGHLNSNMLLIASAPIAILIAMVLFLNEFQDYEADKAARKNTLVVSLGKKTSLKIYVAGMILVYISYFGVIMVQGFSLPLLLPFITIPLTIKAISIARKQYTKIKELEPSNALTILIHLIFGILMAISFIIA